MKWKFGLLSQVQLGLMRLLLMVMAAACKRNAPRYEPEPLSLHADVKTTMDLSYTIKDLTKSIANAPKPYGPLLDKLPKCYKASQDIENLLKDIDWKGDLTFNVVPPAPKDPDVHNDFSALIEAHRAIVANDGQEPFNGPIVTALPDRLSIFLERNLKDGRWDRRRFVPTECITLRSNPVLPDSQKHSFALMGFLIDSRANNNSKAHLVAFVQLDQTWFYYNKDKDGSNVALVTEAIATKEAMRLASEHGIIFFYQKRI